MTDTIDLSVVQMALLKGFHREILTRDFPEVAAAVAMILDRDEVTTVEVMAIQEVCRSYAAEWGSPELSTRDWPEGVSMRSLRVLEGGKS